MKKQARKKGGLNRIVIWGWVLLIGFLIFQWVLYATSGAVRPGQFAAAAVRVEKLEADAKEKGVDDGERIATLTKRSLFSPPAPRPEPPKCMAILGDSVLVNGEWYRVGQEVAGATIKAIDATSVTLQWQESEVRQYPFESGGEGGGGGREGRSGRSSRGSRERSRGESMGEMGERPPGPPGGFGGPGGRGLFNMSPEDREQMRERFQQMREQYEQMSPAEQEAARQQIREQMRNFQR